jgi:hypothetical protein
MHNVSQYASSSHMNKINYKHFSILNTYGSQTGQGAQSQLHRSPDAKRQHKANFKYLTPAAVTFTDTVYKGVCIVSKLILTVVSVYQLRREHQIGRVTVQKIIRLVVTGNAR